MKSSGQLLASRLLFSLLGLLPVLPHGTNKKQANLRVKEKLLEERHKRGKLLSTLMARLPLILILLTLGREW